MSDYGPSITACKLYRRKSAKGQTYFSGRMGNLRVAVVKSNETSDDGAEIWNIVYSQAAERPRDSQSSNASRQSEPAARPEPVKPRADPIDDGQMPF